MKLLQVAGLTIGNRIEIFAAYFSSATITQAYDTFKADESCLDAGINYHFGGK
jgi:hypothetical protein